MTRQGSGQISLSKLAPSDWFTQPENSSFWLRIYSCLFVPHDSFLESVAGMFGAPNERGVAVRPEQRVLVTCGRVNDIKVPFSICDMESAPNGQLSVRVKVDLRQLPDMPYLFVATPFKIDGISGSESSSRSYLDEVASLICLHAGQNLMRHIAFEGEVEVGRDQIHVPGEGLKMPQLAEGPFLSSQNGSDICEIAAALRKEPDEDRRRRLLLALQLVNHAMRSNFGFLDYWTALEVVCDGGSNRIKSTLAKIYGIKSHNEAAEATRLSVIGQWRHDYVHRGLKPPLSSDVERYIQLLFLDLLRHETGLPPRGHLAGIQKASGYNLSTLGIDSAKAE